MKNFEWKVTVTGEQCKQMICTVVGLSSSSSFFTFSFFSGGIAVNVWKTHCLSVVCLLARFFSLDNDEVIEKTGAVVYLTKNL